MPKNPIDLVNAVLVHLRNAYLAQRHITKESSQPLKGLFDYHPHFNLTAYQKEFVQKVPAKKQVKDPEVGSENREDYAFKVNLHAALTRNAEEDLIPTQDPLYADYEVAYVSHETPIGTEIKVYDRSQ